MTSQKSRPSLAIFWQIELLILYMGPAPGDCPGPNDAVKAGSREGSSRPRCKNRRISAHALIFNFSTANSSLFFLGYHHCLLVINCYRIITVSGMNYGLLVLLSLHRSQVLRKMDIFRHLVNLPSSIPPSASWMVKLSLALLQLQDCGSRFSLKVHHSFFFSPPRFSL